MARLPFSEVIGSPVAYSLAKGAIKGLARTWTIEQLRARAKEGAGITDLERTMPQFMRSMRYMVHTFPSIASLNFDDVRRWIAEERPDLDRAVNQEPEIRAWLRRAWETGVRELTGD